MKHRLPCTVDYLCIYFVTGYFNGTVLCRVWTSTWRRNVCTSHDSSSCPTMSCWRSCLRQRIQRGKQHLVNRLHTDGQTCVILFCSPLPLPIPPPPQESWKPCSVCWKWTLNEWTQYTVELSHQSGWHYQNQFLPNGQFSLKNKNSAQGQGTVGWFCITLCCSRVSNWRSLCM